jgi:hypothetical protein
MKTSKEAESVKEVMQANSPNSKRPVNLSDLPEFAKKNCKSCFGRGYEKFVKIEGADWVLDRYGICPCVLKSKKLPELWKKVQASIASQNTVETKDEVVAEVEVTAEVEAEVVV